MLLNKNLNLRNFVKFILFLMFSNKVSCEYIFRCLREKKVLMKTFCYQSALAN